MQVTRIYYFTGSLFNFSAAVLFSKRHFFFVNIESFQPTSNSVNLSEYYILYRKYTKVARILKS